MTPSFFNIIVIFTGRYHRVQLRYHDCTLSYSPKFSPRQLVNKVTEGVVVLRFTLRLLDGQLQLALHSAHEKIVHHDVVGRVVEFVLNPHQLELPLHGFAVIEQIHGFEETNETAFAALQFGPHQVTYSKYN